MEEKSGDNVAYTIFIKFVILLCVEKINQGKALD
jgi:hypothetical protein